MLTIDRSTYFAPNAAGKTRRLTPEGFLVCEGVPLARTGTQMYAAHELPGLTPGPDGRIIVERLADEVFDDDSVASFEGKPVTINHPSNFVTPDNWRRHAVGHVQNVRRGTGMESDLLLGDIIVKDAQAVRYAQQALPEVSKGYDADYAPSGISGKHIQRRIRGNHTALVPNGRAGQRCAIRDHATPKETHMQTRDTTNSSMNTQGAIISSGTRVSTGAAELENRNTTFPTVNPFAEGFTHGHIVHAEMIRPLQEKMARFRPGMTAQEELQLNEEIKNTLDRGWKSYQAAAVAAQKIDSAAKVPVMTGDSIMFSSRPSQIYERMLREGRETKAAVAPARVTNAATYAQALAAGRAAKQE
jgi:hypothetical protein